MLVKGMWVKAVLHSDEHRLAPAILAWVDDVGRVKSLLSGAIKLAVVGPRSSRLSYGWE